MDVMRPNVKWIAGRCYRINPSMGTSGDYIADDEEDNDTYVSYGSKKCAGAAGDELQYEAAYSCEADVDIEAVRGGGYRLELDDIPSGYYKYIIGKKGDVKRQVEQETRTRINIPKMGHDGNIVISGSSKCNILACKSRLQLIVQSARRKQPFTHFLSIPFTSSEIINGFKQFMEEVMEKCSQDAGVDGSLFQSPLKLHLTIGTLVLLSGKERERAVELLHHCVQQIVRPMLSSSSSAESAGGLMVDVRGVEYMNDDPGEVDVLYAKVSHSNNRLQQLVDGVVSRFIESGLMLPPAPSGYPDADSHRVKLHVTLMNTLFRAPSPTSTHTGDQRDNQGQSEADQYLADSERERKSFNAANIVKLFSDFSFGEHHIDTIHLSQRYSTAPDGYYTPTAAANI